MQTAAVTSHAALTGSPRVSATMAKATAPRRATPIQVSFSRNSIGLLPLRRPAPHGADLTAVFQAQFSTQCGKAVGADRGGGGGLGPPRIISPRRPGIVPAAET